LVEDLQYPQALGGSKLLLASIECEIVLQHRDFVKKISSSDSQLRQTVSIGRIISLLRSSSFGRRLRSVGIPLETRKALPGHANGDITTHYSAVELEELISATESSVSRGRTETPNLMLIRQRSAESVGNEKRVNQKNWLTLCVEMARPERFELPTTWFEGTDAKSGFLINQQFRWPALNLCAIKRRGESWLVAEKLRYRTRLSSTVMHAEKYVISNSPILTASNLRYFEL
jgi:hypothetical protein